MIGHGITYADGREGQPGVLTWLDTYWDADPAWDAFSRFVGLENDTYRLGNAKIHVHEVIKETLGLEGVEVEEKRPGSEGDQRNTNLYSCQPILYAKTDTKSDSKSALIFTEELGKTLCYRTSESGDNKGWQDRDYEETR